MNFINLAFNVQAILRTSQTFKGQIICRLLLMMCEITNTTCGQFIKCITLLTALKIWSLLKVVFKSYLLSKVYFLQERRWKPLLHEICRNLYYCLLGKFLTMQQTRFFSPFLIKNGLYLLLILMLNCFHCMLNELLLPGIYMMI